MTFHPEDVRVLVADDHALYRRGLVMELEEAGDLEVIAEVASGEEAVESACALAPDVVLMDVRMPGIGGIEATRLLVERIPTTRILMLSVSDDDEDLLNAVKAGAAGYLLKETSILEVCDAVRRVAAGHSFLTPPLADRLLIAFAEMAARFDPTDTDRRPPPLTGREAEILQTMAAGGDNEAIAVSLGVADHTVRNLVRNILEKLQLRTRTEAVMYAARTRIIDP